MLALGFSLAIVTALVATTSLTPAARIALAVFALAIVGWTVLDLDETPVAIGAAVALVALGVLEAPTFYGALGNDLIWLMIGGFVIAACVTQSGIAERCVKTMMKGVTTVDQLLVRVTWLTFATAFFVPSTSARAALLLPIFLELARLIGRPRITRALALLFPTIVLLSACASMLGAGAHLVAVDFMRRVDNNAPGFLGWMFLAVPFAVASSYTASKIVGWIFLTRAERAGAIDLRAETEPTTSALSREQKNLARICVATLAAWLLTDWHGIDAALIAIIGALLATSHSLTGVYLKSAIKKVEWNLILFLAGTIVMGEALTQSGAADSLAKGMLTLLPLGQFDRLSILVVCTLISLLAHL
ncbi:MAG: SLC13 family permease, partial [Casimicrobium sp.]